MRQNERLWPGIALAMLVALAVGFALALAVGSIGHRFYEADESAHFINTWFVTDYVRHGFGTSPMGYAMADYLHYPKVSIGHWPPAFYGLLGLVFLIVPLTPTSAMMAGIVVATLPALFIAVPARRHAGTAFAVLGVAWYMLTPIVGESLYYFFVDQMLAAGAVASAAAWMAFSRRPSVKGALLAGLLFAATNLVKGNGLLLGLFVPIHIALTGRWRLLLDPRSWLAGAVAVAVLAPWYVLTAGIADDGFMYKPGLDFALLALRFNAEVIWANVGPLGLIAAVAGAVLSWRRRGPLREWASVSLALIAATLLLHSLLPVALVDRYMATTLPPFVLLACFGARAAWDALSARIARPAATLILLALFALNLIPAISVAQALPRKLDLGSEAAARLMARGSGPAAWLIDGSAGEEGSLIAEAAIADPAKRLYLVRASQLLSSSDFQGRGYALRFRTPEAVLGEMRRTGIAGAVLVHRRGDAAYPHGRQLQQALEQPGSGYRRVTRLPVSNGIGETLVFQAVRPVAPDLAAIGAVTLPGKAAKLGLAPPTR